MERIDELITQLNKQCAERKGEATESNFYLTENGKRFTVPYRTIKQVVFTNVRTEDLVDIQHAARLQYRLMLLDAVIKAKVNFVKNRITIIYNPTDAQNAKEKIELSELIGFLATQGVNVNQEDAKITDYDYYKDFYTYAYNPGVIRERPPYGFTDQEWQKQKHTYHQKMKSADADKKQKFEQWQQNYMQEHPEFAEKKGVKVADQSQTKSSIMQRLFKKNAKKEKGFWFHGI